MKKVNKSLIWAIVGLFAVAYTPAVNAQDDLYYDPATDAPAPNANVYTEVYDEPNNVTRRYDNDDEYYEEDDYAYEYSSRIRRFHRRSVAVDYYDPFFVDLYNYDPFFAPGASIYVYNYNDFWTWRRWNRMNRWNSWGNVGWGGGWGGWGGNPYGWNSWGWNSCYAFNRPWHNPWVANNYFYDPYWAWNGYNPYFQNNHFGNNWINNHYYYDNNNGGGNGGGGYAPQTYTGPRRGGSKVNPGYARIADNKGRLATGQTSVPVIEKSTSRPGRTASDIEPGTAIGNGKIATDRNTVSPNNGGRRLEGTNAEPSGRTRTPSTTTPSGRDFESRTPRSDEGTKPSRLEETPATRPQRSETPTTRPQRSETPTTRPQRSETPTRRSNESSEKSTPRRSETAPSRNEESRPSRRSQERTYDRPSRSDRNDGGSIQSRPSRSNDGGSSIRSNSGGSSRSSGGSSGGSSRGSSGGGGSKSSGGGGRGGRN